MTKELEKITPLENNFSRWYIDVVTQGNLIEYSATKGSMIFKPIAYGIWQNIQTIFNQILAKEKVENVYLPLLMPLSYIQKEKDHVKGFAPELALITQVGEEKLSEPLVIRPTSEALFGEFFQKEVQSYQDLPLLFNQWANILRWEKTTNPFLRNREFLWQEGHTAHTNAKEAKAMAKKMIQIYAKFAQKYLALATIIGQKTEHEKFAGAEFTYTIEAMMKDGRALQSGTSHYLGQNFAKAFDVTFKNEQNTQEFVYQTSWGISTRLIGAIIMSHGDNRGIIIPPMIAPYQIDLVPLFAEKNPEVMLVTNKIAKTLTSAKFRVRIDRSAKTPGFKAAKSEIEGTPLRIEVGPRDLANKQVLLVRRDSLVKTLVKIEELKKIVKHMLVAIQSDLFEASSQRLANNLVFASTYEEFQKAIEDRKFAVMPFAGKAKDEVEIKAKTGATARCVYQRALTLQTCFWTKKKTRHQVIFARAY